MKGDGLGCAESCRVSPEVSVPRSCRSLLQSWIMLSSCRLICASCTQAGMWHTGHSVPTQSLTQHLKGRGKTHYPVQVIPAPTINHQSPERISGFSSDKRPARVSHKCRTGLVYHGKWQAEHHLAPHFHTLSGQPWKTQCLTSWPKFSKAPLLLDSRWQLGFTVTTTHSFTSAILQPSISKQVPESQPTVKHNFHFLLVSIDAVNKFHLCEHFSAWGSPGAQRILSLLSFTFLSDVRWSWWDRWRNRFTLPKSP